MTKVAQDELNRLQGPIEKCSVVYLPQVSPFLEFRAKDTHEKLLNTCLFYKNVSHVDFLTFLKFQQILGLKRF